jgi:hypothetical protein
MKPFARDAARVGFAASAPMELPELHCTRLLCATRWASSSSAVQELLAGRREWLARTAASGVRTALLHASGWLVRWHEGSAAAVDTEWRRLAGDPHRQGLLALHCSEGPPVLTAAVQVVSVHAGEGATDVEQRLRAILQDAQQGFRVHPLDLWQSLSAPVDASNGGMAPRQHVLAIASEDNEAVEMVRLIGLVAGKRVVYQRYAGSSLKRADAGAAYLDVPIEGGGITRLQALPRRAFAAGAPLLGVRDVQTVFLMLGAHAERGRVLLQEVIRLLQGLPQAPAVFVAARCPDVRDAALEMLAAAGGLRVSHAPLAGAGRPAAALAWRLLHSAGGTGVHPMARAL